jgi:hypothetical protein
VAQEGAIKAAPFYQEIDNHEYIEGGWPRVCRKKYLDKGNLTITLA